MRNPHSPAIPFLRRNRRQWIRSPKWFGIALSLLLLAFSVAEIIHVLNYHAPSERKVIGVAAYGAFALVALWCLDRLGRAGVYVTDEGIVIRNPFRSWRMAAYAHLKDGSAILIYGIQGPNPALLPSSNRATGPVETLNRMLMERRPES
jgi:hypothetical protein